MNATVKNCHSPAGMSFVTGRSLVTATDCPGCKHGTLQYFDREGLQGFKCLDCERSYTMSLLVKLGVVSEKFKP